MTLALGRCTVPPGYIGRRAGNDNPTPESTISPIQGLRIWPQIFVRYRTSAHLPPPPPKKEAFPYSYEWQQYQTSMAVMLLQILKEKLNTLIWLRKHRQVKQLSLIRAYTYTMDNLKPQSLLTINIMTTGVYLVICRCIGKLCVVWSFLLS